ncbi:MAG: patatin-like phospholipase family protein [Bacteroidales bacterium]|nr:patatin-like phospholipase family protein [Bacteroidales bacterium]
MIVLLISTNITKAQEDYKMKQPISLVLSGGGARGIAHIGVIEELEKQGFEIKSISGTSMGALVGAVYSIGKMEEFKNWIYTMDKLEIFKFIDFTFSSQGLVKGDRVFEKMKEFIPDTNIEDLKIHYTATATDITNKKEVVFTKGSIYEAVRASIAIPTVFTPVKIENSLLVDGGVINPVPINHVKRTKGDILIVVHVNADVPVYMPSISIDEENKRQSKYRTKIEKFQNELNKINSKTKNEKLGYFKLINKTVGLLTYQISKMMIERYPPDILINVSRESCGIFDFYKAEELVEIGRHEAIESLKEYNKNLD